MASEPTGATVIAGEEFEVFEAGSARADRSDRIRSERSGRWEPGFFEAGHGRGGPRLLFLRVEPHTFTESVGVSNWFLVGIQTTFGRDHPHIMGQT